MKKKSQHKNEKMDDEEESQHKNKKINQEEGQPQWILTSPRITTYHTHGAALLEFSISSGNIGLRVRESETGAVTIDIALAYPQANRSSASN